MKKILSILLVVLMLVGMIPMAAFSAAAAEVSATITFDNTSKRTVGNTSQQVWEENGITVVNQRSANSSLINGVYYNPVRFYSGSTLKVTYPGMVKLEMDCSSTQHATAFSKAVTAMYDANVTNVATSGNVVTVTFAQAVNAFTVDISNGQTRAKWITVYAAQPEETPVEPPVEPPTEPPTEPPVEPPEETPQIVIGDLDGVAGVTEDDAIYLLRHVLMPSQFPVNQGVDFDGSWSVDEDDAIYLLQHVLLPYMFPLR
jgi:hypothetical protein